MAEDGALPPLEARRHAFTGAQVLQLQAAGLFGASKVELIAGDIWDMPAEGARHASLKVWLNEWLILNKPAGVRVACDTTIRLAPTYWPSPDFALFPAARNVAEVTGPELLLAIEISDSSLREDLRVKAEAYRLHGVREVWVCDLAAGATHVHRWDRGWPIAPPVPFTQLLAPALLPGMAVRLAEGA